MNCKGVVIVCTSRAYIACQSISDSVLTQGRVCLALEIAIWPAQVCP